MQKLPTKIEGAWLLKPKVFGDERGFFLESWNRETFRQLGIDHDFVQDNFCRSMQWVLRGLHYQEGEAAQGKLVRVTSGKIFDVMVDMRPESPSFGQWDGYMLDAVEHEQVWIPPGCAHGFLTLSETADVHYKCTAPYTPEAERTVMWNDPTLAIPWPLPGGMEPKLSAKDLAGEWFRKF